ADGSAQGGRGGRRVELINVAKFLVTEVVFGGVPAPGQEGEGGAGGNGPFEGKPSVEFIVLLQQGICKDAADLLPMVGPVGVRQRSSCIRKLLRQIGGRGAIPPL